MVVTTKTTTTTTWSMNDEEFSRLIDFLQLAAASFQKISDSESSATTKALYAAYAAEVRGLWLTPPAKGSTRDTVREEGAV